MSKPETKTINQKITDLNQQVEWFYGDDFTLDQAADKYKTALALASEIKQDLEGLKNQIEIIAKDFSKE